MRRSEVDLRVMSDCFVEANVGTNIELKKNSHSYMLWFSYLNLPKAN